MNSVFEACAAGQTTQVLGFIDDFLQNGISIEQLISNSADYLRSLLLIKNGVTKESLLGNSVERYSKAVLEKWNPIQLERALSIFLTLYRDIRYSLSPRYEIELTFSRLCWLSEYVSNAEVKKAIDAAKGLLMGAGAGTGAVAATPVESVAPVTPTEPAKPAVLPEGLPRFSALQDQDDSTPFPDGGPLPPEQSVGSVAAMPPIEPPADYDDGWTNTDTPPEEDAAYEEQLQAEEAQASYEEELAKEDSFSSKAQPQLDEHFTTADGRDLTIAQLRGSIVAEIAVNEGFIASALDRTGLWKLSDDKVETTIPSSLDLQLLQKNAGTVADHLSKICGKQMAFVVTQEAQPQTAVGSEPKEVPSQVQALVNAFKGTIVTGS